MRSLRPRSASVITSTVVVALALVFVGIGILDTALPSTSEQGRITAREQSGNDYSVTFTRESGETVEIVGRALYTLSTGLPREATLNTSRIVGAATSVELGGRRVDVRNEGLAVVGLFSGVGVVVAAILCVIFVADRLASRRREARSRHESGLPWDPGTGPPA